MIDGTQRYHLPEQNSSEMNVSDLIINRCESQLTTPINNKMIAYLAKAQFFFENFNLFLVSPQHLRADNDFDTLKSMKTSDLATKKSTDFC